ncbi:MAG: type IV toxin-antitoxin system AbiEi family antitoxin domain-containing protein [Acidimicrobiia bacterium]|nr:type IV toxin-antitoxin system AbiEi family antitoxin domain-containing protein [Acidimicrobiia bacterium]MYC57455.1 type IV toxin-antitoxin system AbiEi family antitoxin domain-containing protein [Acidimicrobiia bacterium]MYG94406.1 type IV toxin-antitoxin system AbiEi family antitoxin domain-containing protein [Acidimicrobiia bacterium]MYI30825.1 type IV toxin-antitoxin system AbiEi family antitoxin domain-containing protein [Acidimicrobiia bacterium]
MTAIADKIMKQVSASGCGKWVCSPKDFLHLGNREAVDQALSRLVKAGKLRRIGRGLYDLPRFSDVLKRLAPVEIDAVIVALERRDGIRTMPDGLVAANQLGLTNAVPAKISYLTDGSSRTVKIDGITIQFRHASARIMQWAGKPSAPVFQALRWLGRDAAADAQIVSVLKRDLSDDVKRDLKQNIHYLPSWAVQLVHSISSDLDADV